MLHVLEEDHLLSHWLNNGRTFTQSIKPSLDFSQYYGKDGDSPRQVTGMCLHVMEKHCRTDYQYENSCVKIVTFYLRLMFYRSKLESRRDVSVTRISDGFPQLQILSAFTSILIAI